MSEDAIAVTEYTDEIKEELREKQAVKVFSFNGLRFYECPLSCITADTWEVIKLLYLIDGSKTLLYSGGWGDQPAWLVEAFEIYKIESAKRDANGR